MKYLIAAIAVCLSVGSAFAAESTGAKMKADTKAMAHEAKDAAVDAGRQIGQGSKKAYKSTMSKIKSDVNAGKPGDGSLAAKNDRMGTAKEGRE